MIGNKDNNFNKAKIFNRIIRNYNYIIFKEIFEIISIN